MSGDSDILEESATTVQTKQGEYGYSFNSVKREVSDNGLQTQEEVDPVYQQLEQVRSHEQLLSPLKVGYRQKSQIKVWKNTERQRQLRADPIYRQQEQARNLKRQRLLRTDPIYRQQEQARNTERQRLLRSDPTYRQQEKVKNMERQRSLRADPVYREQEKARNYERQRILRADPTYRRQEQVRNSERQRLLRSDPLYRQCELAKNTQRQSLLRADPLYRQREREKRDQRRHMESVSMCTQEERLKKPEHSVLTRMDSNYVGTSSDSQSYNGTHIGLTPFQQFETVPKMFSNNFPLSVDEMNSQE